MHASLRENGLAISSPCSGPQSYPLELEQVTLARVEVDGMDPARTALDGICGDRTVKDCFGLGRFGWLTVQTAEQESQQTANIFEVFCAIRETHALSPAEVMQRTASSFPSLMCSMSTRGSSQTKE